ncbi:MAG: lysophospholipid acyltransferase family protein, partial [Bacteroidota bacterium]
MIRTFFFFFIVWLSLILSILLFIPFPVFYLAGSRNLKRKYVWFWAHHWSAFVIYLSGSEINISGKELIPDKSPFVILSNHQGIMDIPVLIAVFPYPLSFVA